MILLLLAAPSLAQESFTTGQGYLRLPEAVRVYYAAGFHHGFTMSIVGEAQKVRVAKCTVNMTAGQIQAIIDKYMNDHPERWYEWVGLLAWDALLSVCPR